MARSRIPDRPGFGRWQELTGDKLLGAQQTLDAADARSMRYCAPAVLSFALRQKATQTPTTGIPWFIHRILLSLLYPQQGAQRLEQQQLLADLDREQRAAIFACILVLDREPAGQEAWRRVWDAERAGPREDWFAVFAPPPVEETAAKPEKKLAAKKPVTKKPATKKPKPVVKKARAAKKR